MAIDDIRYVLAKHNGCLIGEGDRMVTLINRIIIHYESRLFKRFSKNELNGVNGTGIAFTLFGGNI